MAGRERRCFLLRGGRPRERQEGEFEVGGQGAARGQRSLHPRGLTFFKKRKGLGGSSSESPCGKQNRKLAGSAQVSWGGGRGNEPFLGASDTRKWK